MTKTPGFATLLALVVAICPASCLDLREVDPCQSLAVALCEKRCGPSRATCVEGYRESCAASFRTLDDISTCADNLKRLADCAGLRAVDAACPSLHPRMHVGTPCNGYCTGGLDCISEVCTTRCASDADCADFLSSAGRAVYCGSSGLCRGDCQGNLDCEFDFVCTPREAAPPICEPGSRQPAPTEPKLGNSCTVLSHCPADNTVCLSGFCSKPCASNADCAERNRHGFASACLLVHGEALCRPTCLTHYDCFGHDCDVMTTIEDTPTRACTIEDESP
jgi:hypothetical protein